MMAIHDVGIYVVVMTVKLVFLFVSVFCQVFFFQKAKKYGIDPFSSVAWALLLHQCCRARINSDDAMSPFACVEH